MEYSGSSNILSINKFIWLGAENITYRVHNHHKEHIIYWKGDRPQSAQSLGERN